MNRRAGACALVAAFALASNSCDTAGFLVLCDPTGSGPVVEFYSTGDCVGTDASLFRGHEWLTLFANGDRIFTDDQIDAIIDGNRHTDYPPELLVHLDNGLIEYLDELLEYHNAPDGQAEHFILRADNTHYEARAEAFGLILDWTKEAVGRWNDDRARALARIGRATHAIQDSYSQAHSVRAETPGNGNPAWCLCKLKTFVPRADGCLTDDIEFHDQFDDERRPGHLTALDSIYFDREECHDPRSREQVRACLIPVAAEAIASTEAYLQIARSLVTTSASDAEVEAALQDYFERYFSFCELPAVVDDQGRMCDRPPPSAPACPDR